uniref:Uncharacterized protein n=1 Tax=Anopheles minimus TaxID=112268 RepID=A0A182W8J5_9DIPT
MDIKNVRKWSREFNSGRTNVHDEERSGRPSVSDAIVQAVEAEMLKNRRATIRDLEEKLGGYHKVSARWVPKQLTEDHQWKMMEQLRLIKGATWTNIVQTARISKLVAGMAVAMNEIVEVVTVNHQIHQETERLV